MKVNFPLLFTYDTTLAELTQSPNSPNLQHRAVLALARAGSLDFAWAEYRRYGLDQYNSRRNKKLLEDIMGLGARLLKDLYLANSGKEAEAYARRSAKAYQAAYEATGGFYSGINAATMALMAGESTAEIAKKADIILKALPATKRTKPETLYFIEATRAEAFLLQQDFYKARQSLRIAVKHDPQNYAAHASTLRQFKMILNERGDDTAWLSKFEPPKPAHFAGHLFKLGEKTKIGSLSPAAQDKLKIDTSDAIQKNDIGFGYGSLAAGADIAIAETLLDEGCQLHITLPVAPDIFLKHSVTPSGAEWEARFRNCWEQASSQDIVTHSTVWPRFETDRFSGNVTMGKAILQADHLSVEATQLLVWDETTGEKGTARNAADWISAGREQIIVPYPGPRHAKASKKTAGPNVRIQAIMFKKGDNAAIQFSDIYKAAQSAIRRQKRHGHKARIGLDIDVSPEGSAPPNSAEQLAHHAVPGGILVSEAVVSFLLLAHADKFEMEYMGRLGGETDGIRAFALKRKG